MYVRLHVAGAIPRETFGFPFPITQSELGHAVGAFSVHVNRTLQSLRRDEFISYDRSGVCIEEWRGLQQAGEFDATYLHIRTQLPDQTNSVRRH